MKSPESQLLNIHPSTPLAEVLLSCKSSCSLAISCHFAVPSRGLSPQCPAPSPHTLGLSPFRQLLFQHFWYCFLQSAHCILVLSPCAFPIARTDTHTHARVRSSWLGILKAHFKFWQKHRVLWQVLRHKSQKFLDSYPRHSIIWNFPKENHENWCSFSFSLDFFLDTFLSLHRPERNTIYITDVFKDAGTNMKLVAQRRENNSVLAGGSARVHDHIGVQFITLSLEKLLGVQPDVKSALINLGTGQCWSALSEGLFPNSHQQQAHVSVTTHLSMTSSCFKHYILYFIHQFSSVQLLSCVQLFATPWTAVRQASLSITNSHTYILFPYLDY